MPITQFKSSKTDPSPTTLAVFYMQVLGPKSPKIYGHSKDHLLPYPTCPGRYKRREVSSE